MFKLLIIFLSLSTSLFAMDSWILSNDWAKTTEEKQEEKSRREKQNFLDEARYIQITRANHDQYMHMQDFQIPYNEIPNILLTQILEKIMACQQEHDDILEKEKTLRRKKAKLLKKSFNPSSLALTGCEKELDALPLYKTEWLEEKIHILQKKAQELVSELPNSVVELCQNYVLNNKYGSND